MIQENITISMEEYKELLIIKGKYEGLKDVNPNITYIPYSNFPDNMPLKEWTLTSTSPKPEPTYTPYCKGE